ncbi:MAG: class I SAM-dependent methyltransferase [Promethearchaeota archaeon]
MHGTPEQFYDQQASSYDEFYDTLRFKLYEDITWDNIQRFLPSKGDILDAGGGTGRWAERLLKLGHHMVLTDISQEMLNVAKEKLASMNLLDQVEFLKLDICEMSCLEDNRFDMALAQGDPVSYCSDAKKALAELTRVTKPGGYVIVSVDNSLTLIYHPLARGNFEEVENVLRTKQGIFRNPQIDVEFPFRGFHPEELRNLLEASGLSFVRLIGKTVLPMHLIEPLLSNEKSYSQVLDLCIQLAEDSYRFGLAGHLEIVARK